MKFRFSIAIILSLGALFYIFYTSIYNVAKYGDAPLEIYEEIIYIEKNVLKGGIFVNDNIEANLSLYVLSYCSFPYRLIDKYVDIIYIQNINMQPHKAFFMNYAAKYRRKNPIGNDFFTYYSPDFSDAFKDNLMACWDRIENEFGNQPIQKSSQLR